MMCVVDRRQLDALARDVLPHVELGPVRDREHADVLTAVVAAVVEVPQLRSLVLRVPLPEVVTEREHPLLGTSLVLVTASPAEDGIEAVLLDPVEQRDGLEAIPGGLGAGFLHDATGVDGGLDRRHHPVSYYTSPSPRDG